VGRALPWDLLLVEREIALARPADGTEPCLGDVLERGTRRDPSVWVTLGRVVDEPARFTHVLHDPKRRAFEALRIGAWRSIAGSPAPSSTREPRPCHVRRRR